MISDIRAARKMGLHIKVYASPQNNVQLLFPLHWRHSNFENIAQSNPPLEVQNVKCSI